MNFNDIKEKISKIDKRILIGAAVGVVVVIVLIIALVVGLGKNKPAGGNKGETQNGTESNVTESIGDLETETGKDSETETGTEEGTEAGTEEGTEVGTEADTEAGTEGDSEDKTVTGGSVSDSQNSNGGQVTRPDDVNGVEQSPVTTKPDGEEVLGVGTADEPYEEIPNLDNMTVTTVAVPAGKVLYYDIQRVGGMWLTIEDADAYVITSDGTRYDAQNGKVAFEVESKMANEYVSFQIGNKGSASKSFTVKFTNIVGTYQNPERISALSGTKSLAKGDSDGYYYVYQAPKTGKIRFYISYTKDSDIVVSNLTTSQVRNFTADDTGAEYIELDVKAGDEVLIQIYAIPDKRHRYPATTITWRGEYA